VAEYGNSGNTMSENANGLTVLKVRSSSNASALAAALSHAIYDGKDVALRAIGAGAVNQAVKAVAIAQGFVGTRGITLSVRPGFDIVKMPEGDITAMVLRIITD